jgi:hypothetical protein
MLLGAAAAMGMCAACAGTGAGDFADPAAIGDEVAASGTVDGEPAPRTSSSGLLYVSQARSAQLEGDWPTVTVTMSDVDAEVLWFQERPARDAGEMRVAAFVDQWEEVGFAADPPNAVIRHDAGDGLGTVVEVSDPTWDQPSGRLSFTATVADHEAGGEPLPWLMSDVSLFIDDSGSSHRPVKLSIANASPGQSVAVELTANGSQPVAFSLGATGSGNAGASVTSESGSLPLSTLSVTDSQIRLDTSSAGGGSPLDLEVALYLEVAPGAGTFLARSASDPGVEVQLALGNSEPQAVNNSETLFSVDGP